MTEYDVNTDTYLNAKDLSQDEGRAIFGTHTLLKTIGDPSGKTVIDMCCGDGRLGWLLLNMGAESVTGVDVSAEMLAHAELKRKALPPEEQQRVSFHQADLSNTDLILPPADLICGLYVLHYAGSREAIGGMGRFIARNLKEDGLCAAVTLNPDVDPNADNAAAQAEEGYSIDFTDGPKSTLHIGDFSCTIWRWSRAVLERELSNAGLCDFRWEPMEAPADRPDLFARYSEWRKNPQCVVFSARKASHC